MTPAFLGLLRRRTADRAARCWRERSLSAAFSSASTDRVHPDDFALILDDYHVIDAELVHDAVTFLVDHLPPQMHLVIASRSDPPLPLARLRARGELTELRDSDLRFTPDEAAAFLNEAMCLDLSSGDVAALETRTEGWIAGLQLAALSMHGREDVPAFKFGASQSPVHPVSL